MRKSRITPSPTHHYGYWHAQEEMDSGRVLHQHRLYLTWAPGETAPRLIAVLPKASTIAVVVQQPTDREGVIDEAERIRCLIDAQAESDLHWRWIESGHNEAEAFADQAFTPRILRPLTYRLHTGEAHLLVGESRADRTTWDDLVASSGLEKVGRTRDDEVTAALAVGGEIVARLAPVATPVAV